MTDTETRLARRIRTQAAAVERLMPEKDRDAGKPQPRGVSLIVQATLFAMAYEWARTDPETFTIADALEQAL